MSDEKIDRTVTKGAPREWIHEETVKSIVEWLGSDPDLIDIVSSSDLRYLAKRIEKEFLS